MYIFFNNNSNNNKKKIQNAGTSNGRCNTK